MTEWLVAKKTATLRVFQIAKELGVSSKDVIEKCTAEAIPGITNHMSTVSIGLAATIREWFAGSDGKTTTVQIAEPVDAELVRTSKARRAKSTRADQEDDAPPAAESVASTAVAEPAPPERSAPAVASSPPEAKPAAPTTTPLEENAPQEHAAEVDQTSVANGSTAEAAKISPPAESVTEVPVETEAAEAAPTNVPKRPSDVKPVGPMLQKPTKATLAGPRVIRVEAPENIAPPRRPARRGAGGPGGPGGPPGGGGYGENAPGGGVRGGRGAGAGAGAGRTDGRNQRRGGAARGEGAQRSGRSAPGFVDDGRPFNWRQQDLLEREQRLISSAGFIRNARRDSQRRSGGGSGGRGAVPAPAGGPIKISEPITIKSLSADTGVKVSHIVSALVRLGHPLMNADAVLDSETAMEIMLERGIELDVTEQRTAGEQIEDTFRDRVMEDERDRSPVVTILGHVDHGKTSLLDRIRNANVAQGEAGGITQATSAFRVPLEVAGEKRTITFIDTPGHEAFTEMRSRGAKVTDVVVLVVAADDGVMPQTIESINHAKAAGVPIIVALNKVDKAEATDSNIQRIFGQLAEHELNPVEWGGSTEVVRVSALKGEGINDLLEVIDLQSQLLELKADFGGAAQGTVLEARVEEGRGPVAQLLVQHGKLAKGNFIVAGRGYGRVRDIVDDRGMRVDEAMPGTPVAISGLSEVPDAGDTFYCVRTLKEAEAAAEERKREDRERSLSSEKVTLDNIFAKMAEQQRKDLPLIVKADVQGSLETLRATLGRIGSDEVQVSIKHAAIGGVNESDVRLAEASGAIIVGFNVTSSGPSRKLAEAKGVDIRFYDVIYDLTDDVTKAAEGLLAPEVRLEVLGHAEVREVFKVTKVGMIAGCYVTDGTIERHAKIRVTRDGIVIEKDRRLEQLKRFKDDVKEVNAGQECGMRIEGYDDIRQGDVLECYQVREVRRTL